MHVVILGCGRVGSTLARSLAKRDHSVAVIDQDATAFARLGEDFAGQTVNGIGFDRDTLTEAGIEQADAFAAVSSGDNSNIIAARVARETFGVERVVARIYDPQAGRGLRTARHPDGGHGALDGGPDPAADPPRRRARRSGSTPAATSSWPQVLVGQGWIGHPLTRSRRRAGVAGRLHHPLRRGGDPRPPDRPAGGRPAAPAASPAAERRAGRIARRTAAPEESA